MENVRPPLALDASAASWPAPIESATYDAIFACNILHISPYAVTEGAQHADLAHALAHALALILILTLAPTLTRPTGGRGTATRAGHPPAHLTLTLTLTLT